MINKLLPCGPCEQCGPVGVTVASKLVDSARGEPLRSPLGLSGLGPVTLQFNPGELGRTTVVSHCIGFVGAPASEAAAHTRTVGHGSASSISTISPHVARSRVLDLLEGTPAPRGRIK